MSTMSIEIQALQSSVDRVERIVADHASRDANADKDRSELGGMVLRELANTRRAVEAIASANARGRIDTGRTTPYRAVSDSGLWARSRAGMDVKPKTTWADRWRANPGLIMGVLQMAMVCGVAFNIKINGEQQTAIMGLSAAILALFIGVDVRHNKSIDSVVKAAGSADDGAPPFPKDAQ